MPDRSLFPDGALTDLDGLVLLSSLVTTASLPPSGHDWQAAIGALRMIQMRAIMAGSGFSDLPFGSYVMEKARFGHLRALYTRTEVDCVFLLFVLDNALPSSPYKLLSRNVLTHPVTTMERFLRNSGDTIGARVTRPGD